jgi:hypothetical protein
MLGGVLLPLVGFAFINTISAAPYDSSKPGKTEYSQYYDVQAHRGGRGQCVENTIASFAWGLISGATTLELDVGGLYKCTTPV